MQYAIMKTGMRNYLLDANEVFVFHKIIPNIRKNPNAIIDHEPDEEEFCNHGLYYGMMMIDHEPDKEDFMEVVEWAKSLTGCGLVRLKPNDDHSKGSVEYSVIREIEFPDITIHGMKQNFPFAAYMELENEINFKTSFSETYFPKLKFNEEEDPNVMTSFLNRKVIFSVNAKEKRGKDKINEINWKQHIDYVRVERMAINIK